MRINKIYLDKFKKVRFSYWYMISRGVYLSFNSETLKYEGIEMFYLGNIKEIQKLAEEKLNKLINLDYLEVE